MVAQYKRPIPTDKLYHLSICIDYVRFCFHQCFRGFNFLLCGLPLVDDLEWLKSKAWDICIPKLLTAGADRSVPYWSRVALILSSLNHQNAEN